MKGRESGMPDISQWEAFFNTSCILDRLDLLESPGDVVEFGCGYGIFTLPAAQRIRGTVFALEIETELVLETSRKVAESGLENVLVERRDFVASGCGRPDESIGYAMLFNILHIEDPVGLLREACRALKPGGKVGIIHWRNDIPTPRGPSFEIRPGPVDCRRWGEEAGLQFVRDEELCCCSWHWGMVMQRP